MIPYGRQDISQADVDAVVEVLRSDWLTQGPVVPRFEQTVAEYVGSKYGIAVNSATSALHVACLALGVGPGDTVWTSPNTFVASANAALYCGAKVDFVDIDPRTYNMSIERLTEKLEQAKETGALPKVVIPVHFAGQSCDMAAIHALSKAYGFSIIEDASHAIGGAYRESKIGSCDFSDIVVFSFHPVKIVTTGEGGMALTNDPLLADKMKLFRSHGITRDAANMTQVPDGQWYYQQIELGFNYRMTEFQAALGISQMSRLNDFVDRRRQLARRYDDLLGNLPIIRPWQHADCCSCFHLYVIRLQLAGIRKSQGQVFDELRSQDIGVNLHYIPVHTQPYYRAMGFKFGDFSEAELYYTEAISLPIFPTLSDSCQDHVVETLSRIISS